MMNFTRLDDVCLSGGAEGADLQWGMCAGSKGMKVIHWSFEGHKTRAPEEEVVRLTDEQLAEADPYIKTAAKLIGKSAPHKWFVKRLIQRNYYQVQWAESVYAVANIENDIVQGGTAWAVYMYLQRDVPNPRCYVYDQARGHWLSWTGTDFPWEPIAHPPTPKGVWAGIGTRELMNNGKQAIRDVLGYEKLTG